MVRTFILKPFWVFVAAIFYKDINEIALQQHHVNFSYNVLFVEAWMDDAGVFFSGEPSDNTFKAHFRARKEEAEKTNRAAAISSRSLFGLKTEKKNVLHVKNRIPGKGKPADCGHPLPGTWIYGSLEEDSAEFHETIDELGIPDYIGNALANLERNGLSQRGIVTARTVHWDGTTCTLRVYPSLAHKLGLIPGEVPAASIQVFANPYLQALVFKYTVKPSMLRDPWARIFGKESVQYEAFAIPTDECFLAYDSAIPFTHTYENTKENVPTATLNIMKSARAASARLNRSLFSQQSKVTYGPRVLVSRNGKKTHADVILLHLKQNLSPYLVNQNILPWNKTFTEYLKHVVKNVNPVIGQWVPVAACTYAIFLEEGPSENIMLNLPHAALYHEGSLASEEPEAPTKEGRRLHPQEGEGDAESTSRGESASDEDDDVSILPIDPECNSLNPAEFRIARRSVKYFKYASDSASGTKGEKGNGEIINAAAFIVSVPLHKDGAHNYFYTLGTYVNQ